MKKIVLFAIIGLGIAFSGTAKTVTTTFLGTKARNSETNPCKGATTRVCATVSQDIPDTPALPSIRVTVTVKDAEGRILRTNSYDSNEDQDVITQRIIQSAPANAFVTVSENSIHEED